MKKPEADNSHVPCSLIKTEKKYKKSVRTTVPMYHKDKTMGYLVVSVKRMAYWRYDSVSECLLIVDKGSIFRLEK